MNIKEDESGLFIELDDSEVAMFAKIGINHAVKEGMGMIRFRQGTRFGPQEGEWDEERIDVIGQNGNEGIHYPPHDDYIMDNPTEEDKKKNLNLYNKRMEDDIYI